MPAGHALGMLFFAWVVRCMHAALLNIGIILSLATAYPDVSRFLPRKAVLAHQQFLDLSWIISTVSRKNDSGIAGAW